MRVRNGKGIAYSKFVWAVSFFLPEQEKYAKKNKRNGRGGAKNLNTLPKKRDRFTLGLYKTTGKGGGMEEWELKVQ